MLMNLRDLRIEFYKSSGPGGQHKNKRNMATRVTHIPTGITAVSQEHRSQAQNKKMALARLRAKLEVKFKPVKRRVPTKISKSVKRKILDWKKKEGAKKRLRREKFETEQ